jgi:Mu-like prophage tail sheath protein gpL
VITNPDLPISVQLPGVYVYLSLIGAAPVQAPLRVLFLSYKTSAGTAQAGTLFRAQAEDEVVTKCGTGSGLHRYFRAFAAQGGATVGAETWFMPVSAPSGTAQTKFIKVLEMPTGAVLGTTGTGAAAAGYWTLWIAGKQYDSTIANGSTYATIMQDMVSVIQADQRLPALHGGLQRRSDRAHLASRSPRGSRLLGDGALLVGCHASVGILRHAHGVWRIKRRWLADHQKLPRLVRVGNDCKPRHGSDDKRRADSSHQRK